MKKIKIKEYLYVTFGTLILVAGIYFFSMPNGFSTGGVTGIGIILGKIAPFISSATWISGLNIVMLLLGFIVLGKETGIYTVYSSILFSLALKVLEYIYPMTHTFTDEPLLELLYGMMLTGIGSAMIFNVGGSSGGTEILALVLQKYTKMQVGKALLAVDFLVAFSAIYVFDVKIGLFSVAGLFINSFVVDGIIESMNSCKYFVIVTKHPEEIRKYIVDDMERSGTMLKGYGCFSGEEKTMIHIVCKRYEAVKLRRQVKKLDPKAFIVVTTSSEIVGEGFLAD